MRGTGCGCALWLCDHDGQEVGSDHLGVTRHTCTSFCTLPVVLFFLGLLLYVFLLLVSLSVCLSVHCLSLCLSRSLLFLCHSLVVCSCMCRLLCYIALSVSVVTPGSRSKCTGTPCLTHFRHCLYPSAVLLCCPFLIRSMIICAPKLLREFVSGVSTDAVPTRAAMPYPQLVDVVTRVGGRELQVPTSGVCMRVRVDMYVCSVSVRLWAYGG